MRPYVCRIIFIILLSNQGVAGAYELYTHAGITKAAFARSVLNDTATRADLGILMLEGQKSPPYGDVYYDASSNDIHQRIVWDYEGKIIKSQTVDPLSLSGWLMRGAIREDDLGYFFGEIGSNPHDDPYGDVTRVVNHFFDPWNNKPLDTLGLSLVYSGVVHSAPNWAIGSAEGASGSSLDASSSNTPESGRRNHFTIFDAREAMYRALTLFRKDANGNFVSLDDGTWSSSKRVEERKKYWATTFRSLGDILHLNQDMAQPQHTRNEVHSGYGNWLAEEVLTGHASELEARADARARQEPKKDRNGQLITPQPLIFDTNPEYPIPDFDRYSDFWSTSPGSGSVNGKGLADYSNAGFYTPKHGFSDNTYLYPSGGNVVTMNVNGVDERYLSVSVNDHLRGGTDSVLELRRSIWDDVLEALGDTAIYSLDDTNYDAMADALIPRAVAYSAGIINYFFRGKMQIDLPDEGVYGLVDHSTIQISDPLANFTGFNKIKLKLSNVTPNNDAMTGGKLMAVLRFRRDTCYTDDLSGYPPIVDKDACHSTTEETVVSDLANNGADVALDSTPLPLEFNFQKALPINATDVRLQVVYRGVLGQETDAVVVATKDIGEPTYFSYMDATDYLHIGSNVYTRYEVNADSNLLAQIQPQSCVDYNLQPPQLKSTCFQPITLTEGFESGSGTSNPVTMTADIPIDRFMRIAFLGDASAQVTLVETQGTSCYPQGDFQIPPVIWQDYYDPSTNTTHTQWPTFSKLRNVSGWLNASCVWSADGSSPDTPDDRVTKMSDVSELSPVQTQISGF